MQKLYVPMIKVDFVSTQSPESWEARYATWSLTLAANMVVVVIVVSAIQALAS